jgi:hypothetical protein
VADEAAATLTRLLARWAYHRWMAAQLQAEIEPLVLAVGHTVETADARATWSEGRGVYDWEGLARALKAPKELLKQHAQVVIDWRAVCLELGVPESLKARYYTPPEGPRVTLKLLA